MSFYVFNQMKAQSAPLSPAEPEELHFPTRVPAASAPSPATLNSPNLQSFIVKEKGEKKGEEGERRWHLQAVILLKGGWMRTVILT